MIHKESVRNYGIMLVFVRINSSELYSAIKLKPPSQLFP